LSSDWYILVNTEAILFSLVIDHFDKKLLQKGLKIKYSHKDKYIKCSMQLLELYQTINNVNIYDDDTSYNHILTSIREKYTLKNAKHLRDEFCRIYEKNEDRDHDFDDYFSDFKCEYDAICLFALLYCWFKMNKANEKDWIGIPECIKDIDDDRLKNTLLKKSIKNYLYLLLIQCVSRGFMLMRVLIVVMTGR
jgi:hypothetical protein